MAKVIVIGWNYEGAAFRGIPSYTDERSLRVEIESESEQVIADYVLDNFSYGPEQGTSSLRQLVGGYEDEDYANGDGCGGVMRITAGDYEYEADDYEDYFGDETLLDLSVNLDNDPKSLNQLVSEAV